MQYNVSMRKVLLITLITIVLLGISARDSLAIIDPQLTPNNRFGIHILSENDLENAANLVNSSGGDWGYVTVVIRKDERNIERWQRVFDNMRRLHLIPIVRIASTQGDGHWEKLTIEDIDSWVYFLNSLNWVVKNHYVVIGNEPNHASEWGGDVNPEEYSKYLYNISKSLKIASDDFFVLPAGFDASAPNGKKFMSEDLYIKKMIEAERYVFDYVDGWTSHSYPNPGFSGSVDDTGRGTVRTYEWELSLLEGLGVEKDLPVFITETGWAHDMEAMSEAEEDKLSNNYKKAFEAIWKNKHVVAITPFVLDHTGEPFNKFSWKNKDGSFYKFYDSVKNVEKISGEPVQTKSALIYATVLPDVMSNTLINTSLSSVNDEKIGVYLAKNTGQNIWEKGELSALKKGSQYIAIEPVNEEFIDPNETGLVYFKNIDSEVLAYTLPEFLLAFLDVRQIIEDGSMFSIFDSSSELDSSSL